jgi:hypothetical protein
LALLGRAGIPFLIYARLPKTHAASDFAYPKTTGERPPNAEEGARYFAALDALAVEDLEVHRLITEVFQLAKPLSALSEEPLRSRVLERQRKPAEA